MSSLSTRTPHGMTVPSVSRGGDSPLPDVVVSGRGDFVSRLSTALAGGFRCVLRIPGAVHNYLDPTTSAFSLKMWKDLIDEAALRTSAQQMGDFFLNGALISHYITDDIRSNPPNSGNPNDVFPGGTPTFADLEAMAEYSKSKWSMVPCAVRIDNMYLRDLCFAAGASHYTHVDYGWAQWHKKWGNAMTWLTNHVNAGRQVKLGAWGGFNLLNGGKGDVAPWNVSPDRPPPQYGMSPSELQGVGAAFSALTTLIGWNGWADDETFDDLNYFDRSDIQQALADYIQAPAIGRVQGPFNYHSSATTSSNTVAGNWTLVDSGGRYRTGDAGSIPVPVPEGMAENNLYCILAYSRDTARSPVLPSDMSEAARVSGNSARGGELALFYKLATGTETGSKTITFSGAGGTGSNVMAHSFAFSGNTTRLAGLLCGVGSDSSWPRGSSNMGPVKGVTSTVSDPLVLICAAKANDFANGDPTPDNTMSATTAGTGETWSRLFIDPNASGDDAGMFVDYAFMSGIASITTKSWTQGDGAGSNSSAAGCGFMVCFAPASIISGTAPTITNEFEEDTTLSVGSHLSFNITSIGSTPITYSKVSAPSNLTLNSSTGNLQWTALSEHVGANPIQVRATNSFGVDDAAFTVTVVTPGGGGNSAPVITHPGDMSVSVEATLSFQVVATDADGDPLTYSLDASSPEGAQIGRTTGSFTWRPSGDQGPASYGIVILVSDGQEESRSTFTINVLDNPWTRLRDTPSAAFRRV